MTEETTNLVLDHLRHLRAQLGRVEDKVDALYGRMGIVERHIATVHVSEAIQNSEIDRVNIRLDRIERRLELTE